MMLACDQKQQRHPATEKTMSQKARRVAGYRGIWFELGQKSQYGDKYSGGLGTYTANHQPMAVYAPAVNKTFFTYGGTTAADQRHLVIMVSYYDHAKNVVPQPVVVCDKQGVNDPHDNGSLTIDEDGHLWAFVSGRGTARPGFIYRTKKPYDIESFEQVWQGEMTYPQAWWVKGEGFILLHSRYRRRPEGLERQLWCMRSNDGKSWHSEVHLAAFGGHYQTSGMHKGKIATFFNYHPDCNVDKRSNVYYLESSDLGVTWTTAAGAPVKLPLVDVTNGARIADLRAVGEQMYTCDLTFDQHDRAVLLCVISRGGTPGPSGAPHEWTIFHWSGTEWLRRKITTSDHNYDMGSLYITGNTWRVIAPTDPGPQPLATGGEMVAWISHDAGITWQRERTLTANSTNNHSYARRPVAAKDPFTAFWADGHAHTFSPSRIYFTDSTGNVFRLPDEMTKNFAEPERLPAP
jgi:hypothetical protein